MDLDLYIKEANQRIIKDYKQTDLIDPITKITDDLFLGQGRTTAYVDILIKLGITHIVSIGRTPHQPVIMGPFYKFELENAKDIDRENLSTHFPAIFNFIRKALSEGGRVYCHCEMSVSRGPTVMIAFLRANGYCNSLQSAYDYVKQRRPWISPNEGFKQQLRDFFSEKLI
jgi:hypothetical protein